MNGPILAGLAVWNGLRDRLQECPSVQSYGPDEAPTLVHAFADIEESSRRFLIELLPQLVDPAVRGEALEDLLATIQEEFRHILYHMHDPEYFRVVEPTHDWLAIAATRAEEDKREP